MENQPQPSLTQGYIDAPLAIEQHPSVQFDVARCWPLEAGKGAEQLAFARTRGAKNAKLAAAVHEAQIEFEFPQLAFHRNVEAEGLIPPLPAGMGTGT